VNEWFAWISLLLMALCLVLFGAALSAETLWKARLGTRRVDSRERIFSSLNTGLYGIAQILR
jgi:hypothetical protein